MKKKLLCFMIVLCVFGCQMKTDTVSGADTITERKFTIELMKKAKIASDKDTAATITQKAYQKGILKEEDKKHLSAKLTRERAAILLNRADVKINGSSYDKKQFKYVLNYKRISDLMKMKKSSRASVIKVYCKGIMTGNSNGYYVQSRKFNGAKKVSLKEAQTYISRLCKKSSRKAVSPDGQLIRTSNLPANAGSYPYILTTYPNSFYEKTFEYQKTKFYKKPVALEDFASPIQMKQMKFYNGKTMESAMDKYLMNWCKKVETNMKLRFNVDYRTINNTWVKKLRKTYYVFDDASANKERTNDIKAYVKSMKKNKVVVKASRVTVEPSCLYFCNIKYIRVYVKFKVISGDVNSKVLLYSDELDASSMKKGKWIEKCFDIGIGSYNGFSTGSDYSVVDNKLLEA